MQRFWHISDKSTKAFVPWGKHGSQHFQKSPTVAINGSIRPPNFQKNPYITKIIRPLPISRLSQFSRQNLVIFVGLCLDKFVCQYLENSTGWKTLQPSPGHQPKFVACDAPTATNELPNLQKLTKTSKMSLVFAPLIQSCQDLQLCWEDAGQSQVWWC